MSLLPAAQIQQRNFLLFRLAVQAHKIPIKNAVLLG